MDGIQPYAGDPRPVVAVHPGGPSPASIKGPADYLRAVRRRIWLALAVAIPMATGGTLYVLRMPATYLVTARIEVKAPTIDPKIMHIVSRGELSRGDATDEKYIPDTMAMLNDKGLAKDTLLDQALGLPASAADDDAAAELAAKIKTRQFPLSHLFDVTLDGRDPDRITRTLNLLLAKFKERASRESRDANETAQMQASARAKELTRELANVEKFLTDHVKNSTSLTPGGKSLTEAQYETLRARLANQQQAATSLRQEAQLESMRPQPQAAGDPAVAQKLARLLEDKEVYTKRLNRAKAAAKEYSDPALKANRTALAEIDAKIAELQDRSRGAEPVSVAEVFHGILEGANQDIRATEGEISGVLKAMADAMPDYHKYTTLMREREDKAKQLADLKEKLAAFEMVTGTQKEPVKIWTYATEPTIPKGPNRPLYVGACIVLSLGLGLALVCFLEHVDHSIKVPEHLTQGLGLPLFGVVPRMLRNARNHRGGHLWTSGTPDSIEADAYRNLRASLLGATPDRKPIVTLLVTSAKAGEGKSTTALNLAATCARAGERTLLMDVDLRRPSLNEVFVPKLEGTGLVDVLRGDLPWQRTVVQTDLPNLDFLPTGDTRDVPIEVLGSLELRQLLLSLSEHHYDRVILDGPAVLGLADCRMLGRIVDGALMVVRSGSQELRPLQRAKAMLEQSRVRIVGVVFNGLVDDLQNWSSYGPNPMLDPAVGFDDGRAAGSSRGLGSRAGSHAPALMAAGAVED